jgi:glyoxylase-like metal-dependent hydrolase (beta-lactamase superfamily II)
MSLRVTTFTNGKWRQNCHIISNPSGEALIIDPGSRAEEIAQLIESNGCRPLAILNTHAHYDHIGAVADLRARYDLPFYLHGADEYLLKHVNLYRILFESQDLVRIPEMSHDLAQAPEVVRIGGFAISWIHTPGHTRGSVCLLVGDYLFSGDTLLPSALGRTDLPGGNRAQLIASVKKLMDLPRDLMVCAGHGERTTLKAEFSPGAPAWSLIA